LAHCLSLLQEFHKPGNEEYSVDIIKGADKADIDRLRPDVQSRAKFAAWLKQKLKKKKRPAKVNQNAKKRQD